MANQKPYTVIEPGTQVVLLTYMVGLCPDGDEAAEYDEFPVHLRKLPTEVQDINPAAPNDDLKNEILRRAVKIERREHGTPKERKFTLGHARLTRNRLGSAR